MLWVFLIIASFVYALYRWSIYGDHCKVDKRLDGQLVIITGCNTGIGLETAGQLAVRGAKIIMACRDTNKCSQARCQLLADFGQTNFYKWSATLPGDESGVLTPITPEQLICEQLDVSSSTSIRSFASRVLDAYPSGINILINNAGMAADRQPLSSDSPLEKHMAVNHLGPFLLTKLLLPGLLRVPEEKQRRVINVSSIMHWLGHISPESGLNRGPFWTTAYGCSKLANVIHALELSRRYPIDTDGNGIVAVSLHPGFVATNIFRGVGFKYQICEFLSKIVGKTPLQGAQTTIYCALSPDVVSGGYYSSCRPTFTANWASDVDTGKYLWKASEEMASLLP